MLGHRKSELVPTCRTIKERKHCQYSERCWYKHDTNVRQHMPTANVDPEILTSSKDNNTQKANFWEAQKVVHPGDQMEQLGNMMKIMMADIFQLKQKQNMRN